MNRILKVVDELNVVRMTKWTIWRKDLNGKVADLTE